MLRVMGLRAQRRFVGRSVRFFPSPPARGARGGGIRELQLAPDARNAVSSPIAKVHKARPSIARDDAVLRSIASDVHALQNLYESLANDLDVIQNFKRCMTHILQCHDQQRRVYVTGMGKSGAVAQRLASTLSSIAVSSQWVHGGEWIHGELGGLKHGDMVIIVSHSGRTAELLALPKLFQSSGCCVLAIVGDSESPLSQQSNLTLVAAAEDEAGCPVPSRSIIVQEAICNAIVQHLVSSIEDGASRLRGSHPGGSIGANFANKRES